MPDEYNIENEGTKKSDFNSAGLINLRLHQLIEKINYVKIKGSFLTWNSYLDALWCELAADVKPESKLSKNELEKGENFEKQMEDINNNLARHYPVINWNEQKTGFQTISLASSLKKKQYDILMNKEIFLRRLMNIQGKGTKYMDDASAYMDE